MLSWRAARHGVTSIGEPEANAVFTINLLSCAYYRSYRHSVWAVAISAVLAGTPEIVQLYNHGVLGAKVCSNAQQSHWKDGITSGSGGVGQEGGREHTVLAGERTVRLHVEGLRCAACGARLKQALLAHAEGVTGCMVDFASGAVAVTGRALRERDLLDTVQRLGYLARVVAPNHEPGETSRLLGKEL